MKKTISYLLFVSLITMSGASIHATSKESELSSYRSALTAKELKQSTLDVEFDPVDVEARDYYINAGVAYSNNLSVSVVPYVACDQGGVCLTQSITISGITKYYQNGQSWSSSIMSSCGLSIGNAGCALTAFTMAYSKYKTPINPGQMNSKIGNSACPLDYASAASKVGLKYQNIYHNSIDGTTISGAKNMLLGILNANRSAVVGMYQPSNTSNTHFVLVKGYAQFSDGSYYFSIYDPSANNNYSTLNQYVGNGWLIDRIKVFYV